jgi:hypothetical protein
MLAEVGIGTTAGGLKFPGTLALLPEGNFCLMILSLKVLHPGGENPAPILQRVPGKVRDPALARQLLSVLQDETVKTLLPHAAEKKLAERRGH